MDELLNILGKCKGKYVVIPVQGQVRTVTADLIAYNETSGECSGGFFRHACCRDLKTIGPKKLFFLRDRDGKTCRRPLNHIASNQFGTQIHGPVLVGLRDSPSVSYCMGSTRDGDERYQRPHLPRRVRTHHEDSDDDVHWIDSGSRYEDHRDGLGGQDQSLPQNPHGVDHKEMPSGEESVQEEPSGEEYGRKEEDSEEEEEVEEEFDEEEFEEEEEEEYDEEDEEPGEDDYVEEDEEPQ